MIITCLLVSYKRMFLNIKHVSTRHVAYIIRITRFLENNNYLKAWDYVHISSWLYLLVRANIFDIKMQQNFLFQAFWQIFKSFIYTSSTTTKAGLEGFNAYNNNNENNDNIHEDILIVAGYSYANVILEYFTQCPII